MTNEITSAQAGAAFGAAAQTATKPAAPTATALKAAKEFDRRCEVLRERLGSADFLANKGLGNEVGFYLFCYDPALELQARAFARKLIAESRSGALGCTIANFNLYDVFLSICRQQRILDRIPAMEERRGLERLETQLKRAIGTDDYVAAINGAIADGKLAIEPPATPAAQPSSAVDPAQQPQPAAPDAVFLTGVGEVYPVLRLHNLFEALQQRGCFESIPIIAFYPGKYTGQSLSLFGALPDGNYYRAFDLL